MMKLLIIIFVALVGSSIANVHRIQAILSKADSDVTASTPELIAKYGYDSEVHKVTTEDGYILAMHRIPGGPVSPAAKSKPVVFLMHGFLLSSADWIVTGPGKGFGYILADAGYDVWMGNARGNTYSKNHTTITDLTSEEFWHFDWHEIGYYDLPAMIDYTMELTKREKIIFMGHSQGSTTFYVMASLRPNYNYKIECMFSLGPTAYVGHVRSPLLSFAAFVPNSVELISGLFGAREFLPSSELLAAAGEIYCNNDAPTQDLCTNSFYLLFGFDRGEMNTSILPTIIGHFPAGASVRQLIHFAQELGSKEFRWYDHGLLQNFLIYRALRPPKYDLSAVTAPVHLLYSDNDYLSTPKDVKRLYSELGNPVELYRVPDENWNHVDFLWGINAKKYIYDHILVTLKERYKY